VSVSERSGEDEGKPEGTNFIAPAKRKNIPCGCFSFCWIGWARSRAPKNPLMSECLRATLQIPSPAPNRPFGLIFLFLLDTSFRSVILKSKGISPCFLKEKQIFVKI
jgi:hypothetical protein